MTRHRSSTMTLLRALEMALDNFHSDERPGSEEAYERIQKEVRRLKRLSATVTKAKK